MAAKKEKKKVKSDAEKQRKLNAIMHRREVGTLAQLVAAHQLTVPRLETTRNTPRIRSAISSGRLTWSATKSALKQLSKPKN